jgi:hypothetical protein
VPKHWAVGTAEEQDQQFFILKYLMAMEHSFGEGREDKPHDVKDGNIEAASSITSI